jgi:hypothetical protein
MLLLKLDKNTSLCYNTNHLLPEKGSLSKKIFLFFANKKALEPLDFQVVSFLSFLHHFFNTL